MAAQQTQATKFGRCQIAPVPDPQRTAMKPVGEAPPIVKRVIEAGILESRLLFPENRPPRMIETWKAPVITDPAAQAAVAARLAELERLTSPAPHGELLSRILVLLSHFRTGDANEAIDKAIAMDWSEDLGDYPISAINEAARRWRRTKKFKPQIVEMIDLCDQICGHWVTERNRLREVIEATDTAQHPMAQRTREITSSLRKQLSG
jgi:hypothetical protein